MEDRIFSDIGDAIAAIVWPPGNDQFVIHPQSGKKRGQGNGVKPIKDAFVKILESRGWTPESRFRAIPGASRIPGKFDAGLDLSEHHLPPFVVEWETGNISSSHRAVNKIGLGLQDKTVCGGILVVPTRKLYRFLTDRVGNFEELSSYFRFWSALAHKGYLGVIAVEHDAESLEVPRIKKGTDGRALL